MLKTSKNVAAILWMRIDDTIHIIGGKFLDIVSKTICYSLTKYYILVSSPYGGNFARKTVVLFCNKKLNCPTKTY